MIKVSVVVPNHGRDISAIKNEVSRRDDTELLEIDVGKERSAQRNMGIDQAQGEFIFVLDSDQVPSLLLIDECLEIMSKNPGCNGIFIPETIRGDDWFTRLRNYERQFYTGTCIDVVRFVRKSICPQFDETMSGPEDADWDLRIPPVKLTSINPLFHDDQIPLITYLRKKAYYTKSMRRFSELHPDALVLKPWYRVFGVFLEHGKWKRLVSHPIMALKLYILIFLRAIIYLKK
jgi:glycosyltransferase involved in cell wall biosynthesis